jgi:hypothetical protein
MRRKTMVTRPRFGKTRFAKLSHFTEITHREKRCTRLLDDDAFDWDPVGVFAGRVMTDVCVKTWPSDVCKTKETLEVKEGFPVAEEAEEVEEVFVGTVDEEATLALLDVETLEGALEDSRLLAELEALEGATTGVVVGVVAPAVVVGVSLVLEGAVLCSGVVAGVDTGAGLWRNVLAPGSHQTQHDLR